MNLNFLDVFFIKIIVFLFKSNRHYVLKSFDFRAKTPANYIFTTELLGKQHPKKLKSGKGRPFFCKEVKNRK